MYEEQDSLPPEGFYTGRIGPRTLDAIKGKAVIKATGRITEGQHKNKTAGYLGGLEDPGIQYTTKDLRVMGMTGDDPCEFLEGDSKSLRFRVVHKTNSKGEVYAAIAGIYELKPRTSTPQAATGPVTLTPEQRQAIRDAVRRVEGKSVESTEETPF